MLISNKNIKKVISGVMAALPTVPYIMKSRQRTSVTAYVLGGIGFAIAGGLVALMLLSPRTRSRALHAAKDTYGKVNQKIGHLKGTKLNNFSHEHEHEHEREQTNVDEYGTATGL